jgi:hypothetical protein
VHTSDKVLSEISGILCKKLYERNQKPLKTSAFCSSQYTFTLCVKSLFAAYDLRRFFGGMSKYHDSKYVLLNK